jgi:hypothetical protein
MYKSIMSGEIPLFNECPLDCLNLIMSYNEKTKDQYKEDFNNVINEIKELHYYCYICGIDCRCYDSEDDLNINFFKEDDEVYNYDEQNDILYYKVFNSENFRNVYIKYEKNRKKEKTEEGEYIKKRIVIEDSDDDE